MKSDFNSLEKKEIIGVVKNRAWITIILGVILFVVEICLSKILSDHSLYGLPQVFSVGMLGVIAILIGNGISMLRQCKKLI